MNPWKTSVQMTPRMPPSEVYTVQTTPIATMLYSVVNPVRFSSAAAGPNMVIPEYRMKPASTGLRRYGCTASLRRYECN